MAAAMTEAHLRGVETHGLRRLRPYLSRIRSGGVDPKAQPAMEQRGALIMIDGRNGIGHYVAAGATEAVSAVAQEFGVGIALVRNSNHFGFAGYYATLIAEHGLIGIVISNGQVCVGPEGATKALLSNNPLAIAAPTGRNDAFLEIGLGNECNVAGKRGRRGKIRHVSCWPVWHKMQRDTRRATLLLRSPGAYSSIRR